MASSNGNVEWQQHQVMKRRKKQILAAIVRTYFTAHRPSAQLNPILRSFIFDDCQLNAVVANFITSTLPSSNGQPEPAAVVEQENDEQARLLQFRRLKGNQFDEFLASNENDIEWQSTIGMSRRAFHAFCAVMKETLHKLDTRFGTTIPLEKRIAIALRKLASGDSYTVTGNYFGVPKSTVHRTTRELVTALIANKTKWIRGLGDDAECRRLIGLSRRKSHLPNIAGIIGSFQIELASTGPQQQQQSTSSFICCQMVCDQNGKFSEFFVENQDSTFETSDLFLKAENREVLARPIVRIGDENFRPMLVASSGEDYPLRSWLLTPFDSVATKQQRELNENVAKLCDNVIGRTTRMLTQRWQILTKKLENAPDYVSQTLVACAVLHNFLVEQRDFDDVHDDNIEEEEDDGSFFDAATDDECYDRSATPDQLRHHIANFLE